MAVNCRRWLARTPLPGSGLPHRCQNGIIGPNKKVVLVVSILVLARDVDHVVNVPAPAGGIDCSEHPHLRPAASAQNEIPAEVALGDCVTIIVVLSVQS